MTFYIYILYSARSDRYYVGHTHDLEARLQDHNHGDRPEQSKKFTFKHRPWIIVASFAVADNRSDALRVEKFIKKQKSRAFLQKLIKAQDEQEKLAQLIRVPFHGINQ
ncbi:MAG: GIY-YIG nuclease family protein [Bacteroidota bacterium]